MDNILKFIGFYLAFCQKTIVHPWSSCRVATKLLDGNTIIVFWFFELLRNLLVLLVALAVHGSLEAVVYLFKTALANEI
jgi:hypothetical protein